MKAVNPDKFMKEKHLRINLNEPKPFKYSSQPERIKTDFNEMYDKHYRAIVKRYDSLITKAIHLHTLKIKSKLVNVSIDDEQFWYEVSTNGEATFYSNEVITKFFSDGLKNSEYFNALKKVIDVRIKYEETFPEYFI